ncbi:MAG: adenylyltransferase/cytidyltransferase family protein, partial [Lentisphaerae bacterium]|nr:adenylyltransferase/cytidyltransferase family protein [Lentisphaerota bacterium]
MQQDARGARIGLLGGTFNPVHVGHLILGHEAAESFDLSRVILMPCARPPHKPADGLLAAEHR